MSEYVNVVSTPTTQSFSSTSVSSPPLKDAELARAKTELTHLAAGSGSKLTSKQRKSKDAKNRPKFLSRSYGNDISAPLIRDIPILSQIQISGYGGPATLLTSSAAVDTFAGSLFTVGSLDNFTSLGSVYDQYKIDLIEVMITPQLTEVTSTALSVGNYITAIDVDDGAAPTTVAQMNSYADTLDTQGTVCHYHRFIPQFAVASYQGAFTAYAAETGWIDCSYPNVQHYGIKIAALVSPLVQNFTITYKLWVSFRALH